MSNKKISKGDWIKNECHLCGYDYMQVYRISRNNISSDIIVWCECPKCNAKDDLITTEEDILDYIITNKMVKELNLVNEKK